MSYRAVILLPMLACAGLLPALAFGQAGNPPIVQKEDPKRPNIDLAAQTLKLIADVYGKDRSPRMEVIVVDDQGRLLGPDGDVLKAAISRRLTECNVRLVDDLSQKLQGAGREGIIKDWKPENLSKLALSLTKARILFIVKLTARDAATIERDPLKVAYTGTMQVVDIRSGLDIATSPVQWPGAKIDVVNTALRVAAAIVDKFGVQYDAYCKQPHRHLYVVTLPGFDKREAWRKFSKAIEDEQAFEAPDAHWKEGQPEIEFKTTLSEDKAANLIEDMLEAVKLPRVTKEADNQIITILVGDDFDVPERTIDRAGSAWKRAGKPIVQVTVTDATNGPAGDVLADKIRDKLTDIDGLQPEIKRLADDEKAKAVAAAKEANDEALARLIEKSEFKRLRLFVTIISADAGGVDFSVLLVDPNQPKQAIASFRSRQKLAVNERGVITDEALTKARNAILNRSLDRLIRKFGVEEPKAAAAKAGLNQDLAKPPSAKDDVEVGPNKAPVLRSSTEPASALPSIDLLHFEQTQICLADRPSITYQLSVAGFNTQAEIDLFAKELRKQLPTVENPDDLELLGRKDANGGFGVAVELTFPGTAQKLASAASAAATAAGLDYEVNRAAATFVNMHVGPEVAVPPWVRLTDPNGYKEEKQQLQNGYTALNKPTICVMINAQVGQGAPATLGANSVEQANLISAMEGYFAKAGIAPSDPKILNDLIARTATDHQNIRGEGQIIDLLRATPGIQLVAIGLTASPSPGLPKAGDNGAIYFKLLDLQTGRVIGTTGWPIQETRPNIKWPLQLGVKQNEVARYLAGELLTAIAKQEGQSQSMRVYVKNAADIDQVLAIASLMAKDTNVLSATGVQFLFGLGSFNLEYRNDHRMLIERLQGKAGTLPFQLETDRADAGTMELNIKPDANRVPGWPVRPPRAGPPAPVNPVVQIPGGPDVSKPIPATPGVKPVDPAPAPPVKPTDPRPATPPVQPPIASPSVARNDPPRHPDSIAPGQAMPIRNTWVVIVGVGKYDDQRVTDVSRVTEPDAKGMYQLLIKDCGYSPDHVTLLVDGVQGVESPTRDAVLKAVARTCAAAKEGDTILFYWVGHGQAYPAKYGEGGNLTVLNQEEPDSFPVSCLVPKDYVRGQPNSTIPLFALRGLLKTSKAEKRVLLIHACESGAEVDQPAMTKWLQGSRLSEEGTVTLTACRPYETAVTPFFSERLRAGLRGMAAIPTADGKERIVEVDYLYHYLFETVPTDVSTNVKDDDGKPHQQHPVMLQYKSGQIILSRFKPAGG